jgi:outer membrane protease
MDLDVSPKRSLSAFHNLHLELQCGYQYDQVTVQGGVFGISSQLRLRRCTGLWSIGSNCTGKGYTQLDRFFMLFEEENGDSESISK